MGPESFHVDGRTDRYDKPIYAFRNFANVPNKTINNGIIISSYQISHLMELNLQYSVQQSQL
jgi:hypothetical protein